jgi:hypothetical protein
VTRDVTLRLQLENERKGHEYTRRVNLDISTQLEAARALLTDVIEATEHGDGLPEGLWEEIADYLDGIEPEEPEDNAP